MTPRTKAILVVHLYGHPADMTRLNAIAQRHGLTVIEDATEALGATSRGRPAGTLCDVAAFSFNGNKIITTGGGGMLLAREPETLERMRHLSLQGRVGGTLEYVHDEVGLQLHALQRQRRRRARPARTVGRSSSRAAATCRALPPAFEGTALTFCAEVAPARSNYWLMSVLVDEATGRDDPAALGGGDRLAAVLRPDARPAAPRALRDRPTVPVAAELHRHGVSIPSSADLDDEAQDRVIAGLTG